MKILCWNIRGIGGGGKVRQMSKMIREERLGFVGVIETKKESIDHSMVKRIWGLNDCDWSSVDAQGASGGILCIWERSFLKLETIQKGDRRVCIKGFINDLEMVGAIIVVYGYHDMNMKRRLWQEILDVKNMVNVPILVMGDFNEIRFPAERKGCSTMTTSMKAFDEWINNLGVIEVPLIGRKFTWRRGNSYSKLGRLFVEPIWLQKFKYI